MVLFADYKKGMLCFRTFEWGYIFRINFVLDGANAKLGDDEPRSLKWLIFGLQPGVAVEWILMGHFYLTARFSIKNLQIFLFHYSYLQFLRIYRVQITFC